MKSPEPAAATRTVRKRLADGTVKEYTYTRAPKQPRATSHAAPDSLGALILAYERSPEWNGLAANSRAIRTRAMRDLAKVHDVRVPDWRRRDILLLRDAIAHARGPSAANVFASTISVLFSFAVGRGWIDHSPAARIKALPGGTYPTWTEAELATALAGFVEPARRALILAVHTAQRRGDICDLGWADIRGGLIRLEQEKTGRALVLQIHPDLARELAAWRRDASGLTILAHPDGRPFSRVDISMLIVRERRRLGLREGLNLHGLRKLAATRLADAGCSTHEIAAWTGHTTLRDIELYTRAADQERLAAAGMRRLSVVPVTTAGRQKTNVK